MKITDLTLTIEEGMMTFPTHWHPVVEITILGRHGIEGRETRKLVLGTHIGTHADAPRHFIPNGKGIDEVPLDVLVGPAQVLNFTPAQPLQEIDVPHLQAKLGSNVPPRIILRTDWSEHFGNTSSSHSIGREAQHGLDQARRTVAEVLGCSPHEIVFTGCGTESDNLAMRGAAFALSLAA